MLSSKKAFTLAEVLITLAIIGVVAALTIPNLINEFREREIVTAFKKDFSDFSNALNMIKQDNGGMLSPGIGKTESQFIAILQNYMNFAKVCSSNSYSEGCADYTGVSAANLKLLNGCDFAWPGFFSFPGVILPNSSVIVIASFSSDCSGPGIDVGICAIALIDTNGAKSPNIYGRDIFTLYITDSGLFPRGSHGDRATTNPKLYGCREAGNDASGEGCAARVLRESAINY